MNSARPFLLMGLATGVLFAVWQISGAAFAVVATLVIAAILAWNRREVARRLRRG